MGRYIEQNAYRDIDTDTFDYLGVEYRSLMCKYIPKSRIFSSLNMRHIRVCTWFTDKIDTDRLWSDYTKNRRKIPTGDEDEW